MLAGSIRVQQIKPVLNNLVQVHHEPGEVRTLEKNIWFSEHSSVSTVTVILLYVHPPATQLSRRDMYALEVYTETERV